MSPSYTDIECEVCSSELTAVIFLKWLKTNSCSYVINKARVQLTLDEVVVNTDMRLPGIHSSCTFLSVAFSNSSIQTSSSCVSEFNYICTLSS